MDPDKPIDCPDLDAYTQAIYEQARKHGAAALQSKDYKDYKAWDLRVGFTSPDGWWAIRLQTIKSHYARNRPLQQTESPQAGVVAFSRLPPRAQMALDFGTRVQKAKNDGDAARAS